MAKSIPGATLVFVAALLSALDVVGPVGNQSSRSLSLQELEAVIGGAAPCNKKKPVGGNCLRDAPGTLRDCLIATPVCTVVNDPTLGNVCVDYTSTTPVECGTGGTANDDCYLLTGPGQCGSNRIATVIVLPNGQLTCTNQYGVTQCSQVAPVQCGALVTSVMMNPNCTPAQ